MPVTINGTSGIVNNATDFSYTGTLTGGTGVVNLGSGQLVKDASGNVGLGVVPSAWVSYKALEMPGASFLGFSSPGNIQAVVVNNGYYDGSWKYKSSGFATQSLQVLGEHRFLIAPSGTAGNVITFTQAMTLTADGNLLVGSAGVAGSALFEVKRNTANIAYFYNNAGVGVYIAAGGTTWVATSDERLKTELTPFSNAVQKVCTLRAGTGRYLSDETTVSRSFLLAQDVLKVLPEAVNTSKPDALGLSYTDLIPLLTAAIQDQQAAITSLTARITALEGAA